MLARPNSMSAAGRRSGQQGRCYASAGGWMRLLAPARTPAGVSFREHDVQGRAAKCAETLELVAAHCEGKVWEKGGGGLMEDHLPAGEAPRAREVLINRRPVVERGGHVQTARCGFIRIQRRDDGGTTGKEVRGSGGTRGGERRRGVRACDRRDRWPSAIAATGKEQWGKQLEPTGHANHWSLQWEQRACRGLTPRPISRGWNTRHPNSTRGSLSHGQSLSPPCRSSRMELGIAAPLHVGIDGVDLGRG